MSPRLHRFLLVVFSFLLGIHVLVPRSESQSTYHSVLLEGTSSYVDVPYNANLNITGALTMEAWVKTSATSYQTVLERGDWWQNQMSYEFSIGEGKVRMDIMQSNGSYVACIGSTVMNNGAWHHIAGVYDGSQMRVYVDGVSDGSATATMTPGNNATGLRIGKSSFLYYPNYFNGRIDEVRVSNAALYTSNFTPSAHLTATSSTKGLWKFDGQTTNDSSGSGAHGLLQGSAQYSTDVPTGPNNPPAITLNDPQNNTNFAAGSNMVIDASASDSDGNVAKVEFFQGTTLLGTDLTAPYTFVWSNVAAGSYAISARATDDLGTTTNTTPITITVNQAGGDRSVLFNGTSSYVDVPYNANLNITGALTIEAWVKTSSTAAQQVVERGDWWQNQMSYQLTLVESKARLDIMQSNGTYTAVSGNTAMSLNVWHHVAGVYDGSQMRVYVDGVLNGSATATMTPGNNSTGLRIGKSSFLYYPNYFNGRIDEVRVSNAALYTGNFTPSAHLTATSNTKGLWKFDGETTNDGSASAANGSLQGGATYSTDVPVSGGAQVPVAMANGPYTAPLGQTITFSNSGSFDPDGTISSYHWNFGDGTSANTQNPSHVYQTSGYFTATLTVTDNAGLRASTTAAVTISGANEARLDPMNATGGGGENPLSRNFNWTLPLLRLPGRAGLDLGLALSYNSLVWTKLGSSTMSFDDDRGFPAPGFRLGFPTIQLPFFNSETGKNAYLLIEPDGSRTELRQTADANFYESADSAHLLLDVTLLTHPVDPRLILKSADGSQMTYKFMGQSYECTEIKDRNGNYITINYNSSGLALGRIANIHDTLNRVITFNYENGLLSTITQEWKRQPPYETQVITHTWASFAYEDLPIQTNFATNLSVVGVVNNSAKVLSKVTLADNSETPANNSHVDFSYTPFGQVWKISNSAADANHLLNYRAYKLPKSPLWTDSPVQNECPRLTERRDWGQWANGDTDKTPAATEEIVTIFSATSAANWNMPDGIQHSGVSVRVTAPDGTFQKIYFADTVANVAKGWLRGLPELVESFDTGGSVALRQVFTSWEQDDETLSYELNPRAKETAIYDPALAHPKRTRITYQAFTPPTGSSYKLPRDVFEYDSDASIVLRSTRTDYIDGDDTLKTPYLSRRIFGLVKETKLYQGDVTNNGTLMSDVRFSYDESGSIDDSDTPIQHANPNFVIGRGNVSTITRYDVLINNTSTFTKMKYNRAGAVVSRKNALDKEVKISYADSFSDGNNRSTFAYPTTITDPDSFYSTTKYNFDFGSVTFRQTPPPNATTQALPSPTPVGPAQTFSYDDLGRLERTTNLANNSYTRYQYPTSKIRMEMFSTLVANKGEAYSFKIVDGFGREIASASDHPATTGTNARFDAQRMVYDIMGRVIKSSNPAETSASGDDPAQWQLVEGDAGSSWFYTQYTYDWKGRPKTTTNTDSTTKSATYDGCGCAGGEVVTLTDEGTIVNGATKTRQKKIYSDVLGRTVKTEVWNFDGTGPGGVGRALYSTTVTNYNARDQAVLVRQFKGAAPANYLTDLSCPTGTCQKTELTYDGYGRLVNQHVPEQSQNPYAETSWTYNDDDTVNTITDGRGALTIYGYGTTGNNRRLVKSISYTLSGSLPIEVSFGYDATGKRKSMSHSIAGIPKDSISYTYDELLRLTSETRTINALVNSPTGCDYTIAYGYTLGGQLSSVTDPFGSVTNLHYDAVGRTESVSGSYDGISYTYVNDMEYRAWGAVKSVGAHTRTGSEVKTIAYNNRLQPTEFRYHQWYNYTYHPDGQLNQLIDPSDVVGTPSQITWHYMSRAYSYDHAGRLSSVNQLPSPWTIVAPFIGTYTYDEFNNLSSREGRYALNPNTSDSGTYVNNKRTSTGWSYDPDGRVLTSADTATGTSQTWTYDAAGNQTGISEVSSGATTTNSLSYDGDGELLYESVTTPQSTKADYLIRSTVLGTVLTKLDAAGNKDITYVPANGLTAPMQMKDSNGNPFVRDVYRDVTGLQEDGKAYDPFGALIANVQPPSGGPPPTQPFYGATYAGVSWNSFIDANNLSSGCRLDGVRTGCTSVLNQLGRGNADLISLSTTGTLADFLNTVGTIPRSITHSRYVANTNLPPHPSHEVQPDDVEVTNTVAPRDGHWEYWEEYIGSESLADPQNPLIQDDPKTIPGESNTRDCTLSVSFESGTFYEKNSNLPNGPSPVKYGGITYFGLGFTISGTVKGGNGIGQIGYFQNPENPKGKWIMEQWTSSYATSKGEIMTVQGRRQTGGEPWMDLDLTGYFSAPKNSNRYSRYDHPTIHGEALFKNQSFFFKVYNGNKVCSVAFHVVQRGNAIHWGKGAVGVWPN